MKYDLNITVYGQARRIILETIGQFDGENANEAIETANRFYADQGTCVVRGANPSAIQGTIHLPKKLGRPAKVVNGTV